MAGERESLVNKAVTVGALEFQMASLKSGLFGTMSSFSSSSFLKTYMKWTEHSGLLSRNLTYFYFLTNVGSSFLQSFWTSFDILGHKVQAFKNVIGMSSKIGQLSYDVGKDTISQFFMAVHQFLPIVFGFRAGNKSPRSPLWLELEKINYILVVFE